MRILTLAIAIATVSGCAAPSRYQWGGYDEMLYQSYKDATKVETLRLKLEQHITTLESAGQKVAPGLYADLGTLYLQKGQAATAVNLYAKERSSWPESKGLMDALIQNVERIEKSKEQAKQ